MSQIQPILPFLGWLVLGIISFLGVFVGAVLAYLLRSFLGRVENLFVKVGEHDVTIAEHTLEIQNLKEGVSNG